MSLDKIKQLKLDYNTIITNLTQVSNISITDIELSSTTPFIKTEQIKTAKELFHKQVILFFGKLNSDILKEEKKQAKDKKSNNVNNAITSYNINNNNNNNNKKALLIGINYSGSQYELSGCINDTIMIKTQLVDDHDFNETSILTLTDTSTVKPTKTNILNAFKHLLSSAKAGDVLFFSFSGHGSNIFDDKIVNEDDEMIVSIDLECIMNYELTEILVLYLKPEVTLFALFDSCQCDIMFNLKYKYLDSNVSNFNTIKTNIEETVGNVYVFSGSTDYQTADAYINNIAQGAMTWAFLETLNQHMISTPSFTWKQFVLSMRSLLKEKKYKQVPQFCCGKSTYLSSTFTL